MVYGGRHYHHDVRISPFARTTNHSPTLAPATSHLNILRNHKHPGALLDSNYFPSISPEGRGLVTGVSPTKIVVDNSSFCPIAILWNRTEQSMLFGEPARGFAARQVISFVVYRNIFLKSRTV